jgi:hypothetical protein
MFKYYNKWKEKYTMAKSKDQVKFKIPTHRLEDSSYQRVIKEAFGLRLHHYCIAEEFIILCRPSQFARFLILRHAACIDNLFAELNAELVTPEPVAPVYDVTGNPA